VHFHSPASIMYVLYSHLSVVARMPIYPSLSRRSAWRHGINSSTTRRQRHHAALMVGIPLGNPSRLTSREILCHGMHLQTVLLPDGTSHHESRMRIVPQDEPRGTTPFLLNRPEVSDARRARTMASSGATPSPPSLPYTYDSVLVPSGEKEDSDAFRVRPICDLPSYTVKQIMVKKSNV